MKKLTQDGVLQTKIVIPVVIGAIILLGGGVLFLTKDKSTTTTPGEGAATSSVNEQTGPTSTPKATAKPEAKEFCEKVKFFGDMYSFEEVETINGHHSGMDIDRVVCDWKGPGRYFKPTVAYIDVYLAGDAFDRWASNNTLKVYPGLDLQALVDKGSVDDSEIIVKADNGWAVWIRVKYDDKTLDVAKINEIANKLNEIISANYN